MTEVSCLGHLEGEQRFGDSQQLFWGKLPEEESWEGSTLSKGPCHWIVRLAESSARMLASPCLNLPCLKLSSLLHRAFFHLLPLQSLICSQCHWSFCTSPAAAPYQKSRKAGQDWPCPGEVKDAGADGRALETLQVGPAAPSASGGMGWGNGYCHCKRKPPAATTASGERNRGICLPVVRNQWFPFTLPQH